VAGRAAGNCERCQQGPGKSGHWGNGRTAFVLSDGSRPNSTVRQGRAGSGGIFRRKGRDGYRDPCVPRRVAHRRGWSGHGTNRATELAVGSVRLSVFPMDEDVAS